MRNRNEEQDPWIWEKYRQKRESCALQDSDDTAGDGTIPGHPSPVKNEVSP
jgi:hypothetical protein